MEYRATAKKILLQLYELKLLILLREIGQVVQKLNKSQDGMKQTVNNIETVVLEQETSSTKTQQEPGWHETNSQQH